MDATKFSGKRKLFAAGGLIGALMASTCCIVPLAFVMLGVSGAWMGTLTALAPYQWIFVTATVAFLGVGFWSAYFKQTAECDADSYCASPASDRVVKAVLWTGTVLVLIAIGVNVLAPSLL